MMRWRPHAYVPKLLLLVRRELERLIGTHAEAGKHGTGRSRRTLAFVCICSAAWMIAHAATAGHRSIDQRKADAMFEDALERAGNPENGCEACSKASSVAYTSPLMTARDDSVAPLVWDGSPLVSPELRLIYCSIPKNACTQMKRIVHRIRGSPHWNVTDTALERWHIHKPETNHLTYLRNLSLTRANEIMHDPRWTRVILVRDPIERFASAFLDKCAREYYESLQHGEAQAGGFKLTRVANVNCPVTDVQQTQSVEAVLRAVERRAFWHGLASLNSHFRPQSSFCDMKKYSAAYLAVDVDRASVDVPQCVLKNLHIGSAARASGLAAAHEVLGNAGLVTHRTASHDLARNWTFEADACLANAAALKRSNPQRVCKRLIGMRLRRLYRSDYRLAWNKAACVVKL